VPSLVSGTYRPQLVRGVWNRVEGYGSWGFPRWLTGWCRKRSSRCSNLVLEEGFSESSYGFRPGYPAHQALGKGAEDVAAGRGIVVDLEKFSERVQRGVLTARFCTGAFLKLRSYRGTWCQRGL